MSWEQRYENWEGTAAELASVLEEILRELGSIDDDPAPNERLIRHYAQQGILERPQRRGKEAIFGFRQIVEFLAGRHLLRDGWPLTKAAQYIRVADLRELLDLVPKGHEPNSAEQLVARFRRRSDSSADVHERSSSGSSLPALARSVELTKGRMSRREALEALGNSAKTPERDALVRLALAPWCHVYFDPEALRRLPAETPELLGQALTQCLIDERIHSGGT